MDDCEHPEQMIAVSDMVDRVRDTHGLVCIAIMSKTENTVTIKTEDGGDVLEGHDAFVGLNTHDKAAVMMELEYRIDGNPNRHTCYVGAAISGSHSEIVHDEALFAEIENLEVWFVFAMFNKLAREGEARIGTRTVRRLQ